ncbi:Zinc finger CCHC domain-containing protein 3 [Holothuria leucospilota]|uniref:Zinc finger CCHC domain-containing protein 3 n=1 Tax=Holothuria leucospilota TaxID=206669 RepID=A0A9Q0Y8A3_HOLLE|nr:Zinc finger CCHC domain-containing protein 3 [Holothuria leucospilota]
MQRYSTAPGVRCKVGYSSWRISALEFKERKVHFKRDASVQLKLEKGVVKSVFDILGEKGIDPGKHLVAVQELPGRLYDVTFKSVDLLREFVSPLSCERGLTVSPYTSSAILVTVLHVPHELNDNAVRYVLGKYGRVVSGRFLTFAEYPEVFNGIRQYKIVLKENIPSSVNFGGRPCWVRYRGQPRTCLKCGDKGHEAKDCELVKCFQCNRIGHSKKDCKEEVKCTICEKTGHIYRDCPIAFANVISPTPLTWTVGPKPVVLQNGECSTEIRSQTDQTNSSENDPTVISDSEDDMEDGQKMPDESSIMDVVSPEDQENSPKEVGTVSEASNEAQGKGNPQVTGDCDSVAGIAGGRNAPAENADMDVVTGDCDSVADIAGGPNAPAESADMDIVTPEELENIDENVGKAMEDENRSQCDLFECESTECSQIKASSWADQVTEASSPRDTDTTWHKTPLKRRSESQPTEVKRKERSRSRSMIRYPPENPLDSIKMSQVFLEEEPWHSCYAKGCRENFSSFDMLRKHADQAHPHIESSSYPCALKSCSHVFTSPREWIQHIAQRHPKFVKTHDVEFFDSFFLKK